MDSTSAASVGFLASPGETTSQTLMSCNRLATIMLFWPSGASNSWVMSTAWVTATSPKKIMYGQLTTGSRPTGRLMLRYKDACKSDMKSPNITANTLEQSAANRSKWRHSIRAGIILAEEKRANMCSDKKMRRKAATTLSLSLPSSFIYTKCSGDTWPKTRYMCAAEGPKSYPSL